MEKIKTSISILGFSIIAGGVIYCVHFLQTPAAQPTLDSIRHLGMVGVFTAILFQSLLNMLPLPGEFTAIIMMEIYGPILGGVYLWSAGILGAVAGYYLIRWIAHSFLGKRVEPYLRKMDAWLRLRHNENTGMLLVRFVPLIPYHFVNYAAGMLNIRMRIFVLTTGLGILPHTAAMSVLYAGFSKGSLMWGVAGCIMFLILAGFAWYFKKRTSKSSLKAN